MRFFIVIIILNVSQICSGQSFEQIALDFFAKEILSNQKRTVAFYDGMISPHDSHHQTIGKQVINDFYLCKVAPKGINNTDIQISFEEWITINNELKNLKFDLTANNSKKLNIQKPIRSKKKLNNRRPKGGIRFLIEKCWHSIFPVKFNLSVEPAIHYGDNYYVWIKLDKVDFEYGSWFFIKIGKQKQVIDWCEVYWIR